MQNVVGRATRGVSALLPGFAVYCGATGSDGRQAAHREVRRDLYLDWEPKVRSEAQQIVTLITSFSYIVTFMAVYQYL